MATAGLDGDVVLDIKAALRQVDKLAEALDRATSGVVVTADTRAVTAAIDAAIRNAETEVQIVGQAAPVTGAIDAAIANADTAIVITGDARELTGDIDGAVDDADTHVVITGEATELTGDIDGAVQAANTHVTITADTAQAQSSISDLGTASAAAAGGASKLGAALAGIGALGVATVLFNAAQAASDLAESTSKATAVFGSGTEEIVKFAQAADKSLGLSEQAALEAAGTFGNLFQALGATQQTATELSPKILTLAADLASFNNLGIDDTLEKLRSGLVGEIEPLRGLGISFGAAEVEARALELGLVAAGTAVTEGAKLQARYSLIAEQAVIATGDFERTSGGLANQQRILAAEIQNATAAAGQALLPTLLELVALAREELIPKLSELADRVLPALASILSDLAPLLGTTLDLIVLLAPVIEAVAVAVGAIPTQLLAAAGALILFNKAFGLAGAALDGVLPALRAAPALIQGIASVAPNAGANVGILAKGITGLAGGIGALSVPVVAAAAAGVVLFQVWQAGQAATQEFNAGVKELAGSLETLDGIQQLTTEGISRFAQEGEKSRFVTHDQIDDLARLGVTFDSLARLAQLGSEGLRSFVDQAVRGGEVDVFNNSLGKTADISKLTAEQLQHLVDTGKVYVDGQELIARGNTSLLASYKTLADQTEAVAEGQLLAAVGSETLTQAQVDQALAIDESGNATRSSVEALNLLEPVMVANAKAAEAALAVYGPLADQFVGTSEALVALFDAAPGVANQIIALRDGAEGTDRSFLDLALSLGEAALTEEQMGDAAALLGVDVGDLSAIVEGATSAVNDFVDEATGNLPTLADAFKNVGEDSILSVGEFIKGLQDSTKEMETFRQNLAILAFGGFSDIAGIIAQQGPEVAGGLAATLAKALAEGDTKLLEQVRKTTQDFTSEWEDTATLFREVIGPEFIIQAGLLGAGLTEAFGSNLSFAERIRIAAALAKTGLSAEGQAIAAIAAVEGADAARDYGNALDLDRQTIDEAILAGKAIAAQPTTAATNAGKSQGVAYGTGFADGITSTEQLAILAGQNLTGQALLAGQRFLNSNSPSKVTRDLLGIPFGEGVAVGIESQTSAVSAQATSLIDEAIAAAETAAKVAVPIQLGQVSDVSLSAATVAAAVGGSSSSSSSTSVTFAAGSVVVEAAPGMTRADAVQVGAGIVDGMEQRLAERSLSVLSRAT